MMSDTECHTSNPTSSDSVQIAVAAVEHSWYGQGMQGMQQLLDLDQYATILTQSADMSLQLVLAFTKLNVTGSINLSQFGKGSAEPLSDLLVELRHTGASV